MNWISDDNKKLYYKTFSALYSDIKNVSSLLLIKSGDILSKGYENTKNTLVYYSQQIKYNSLPDEELISEELVKQVKSEDNDYKVKFFDLSIEEKIKENYDIIIYLNDSDDSIKRIWIIESDGNKKKVKGEIKSYPLIQKIILKWFNYEQRETVKWFPQLKLYTEYRKSEKILNPMTSILFKFENNKYNVYKYKI